MAPVEALAGFSHRASALLPQTPRNWQYWCSAYCGGKPCLPLCWAVHINAALPETNAGLES